MALAFKLFGLTLDLYFPPATSLVASKAVRQSRAQALIRAMRAPAGCSAHVQMSLGTGGGHDSSRTGHCFLLPAFFGQRHIGRFFVLGSPPLPPPLYPDPNHKPLTFSPPPCFSESLHCNPNKQQVPLKSLSSSPSCLSEYGHSAPEDEAGHELKDPDVQADSVCCRAGCVVDERFVSLAALRDGTAGHEEEEKAGTAFGQLGRSLAVVGGWWFWAGGVVVVVVVEELSVSLVPPYGASLFEKGKIKGTLD
ncbi:hypothetical protein NFI96_004077 [Prochilodus magdalenae]|nr:hypothetical protein NFI96_004077 [Prochilodus magdalenae]